MSAQKVLVTGAGTGVGRGIALAFAAAGAEVVLHYSHSGAGAQEAAHSITQGGGRAAAMPADFTRVDEVQGLARRAQEFLGGIDVLVNNAGITMNRSLEETTPEQFDTLYAVNVRAPYFLAQAVLPALLSVRGSIINISSVAGVRSCPESAAYCTSKAGLIMLARQVALDYGRCGIRSNAVCPGWVRTPMSEREMEELGKAIGKDREESFTEAVREVPLSRVATPEEVANVCLFLASDESSYMTGAVIMIDGGSTVVDAGTLAFRKAL